MPETTLSSRGLARQFLLTIGLAAAYLLLTGATRNSYILLVMTLIPIWATLGVAWNIFSGYSGLLSFGHAAFFGLGAYTVAILFEYAGITPWVGVVAGAAVGALAGLLVGFPTFRLRGVYFSLAMLAYPLSMLYIFEYLGLQELALPMKKENGWAYMQFGEPRIYILLATAMLVGAVLWNLKLGRSRFGLSLLAIKQNELAAQACGIDPFRWKLRALAISGGIAGLAGALYAVLLIIVTPHSTFGMLVSAQALIFTMFGGVGQVAGPILGAVTLIPLSEFLTSTIGEHLPGIQGVIYGLAIIAVILVAPQGVLTWVAQRRARAAPRPAEPAEPAAATVLPFPAAATAPGRRPDRGPQEVVMRVVDMSRNYGGLKAVSQVSFEVHQGEILGIIGPNGAGKTTLFNLLNGIVPPSAGQVFFEGRELTGLQPFEVCRLGIGRTFQVARPFARLTVLDNVLVGALSSQADDDRARDAALRALEQVGLAQVASRLAGNLTAVQLRLMEVARALASQPRLLLLDEVLAGLGGAEVEQVLHVLERLRAAGMTLVIIEHTMHAMVRLADRLLVLDHGKVLKVGDPPSVTSDPTVIEAYLGKKWVKHAAD
ncbi:branched-chain amino acid ABC transporter ATP-binding protein/permease [Ramlibacter sp. MAHUQ-53]|uniref:branched-chain amino acid ABC transporter ATP-binding protein/permease n=1 Tax=unclassified Ramlibacter TaxID=2617605 RepID=UPI00363B00A4